LEFLQGVAATLRLPGPTDDPVTFAKAPKVTVTRDSDGSAIATDGATKEEGEGEDTYYTFDLSGEDLSEVDLLTAVWSDGDSSYTTYAEVVGSFVTSLKAIKKKFGQAADDDDVNEKREIATRNIESACGVAYRARYGKATLEGTGTHELLLSSPQLLRVLNLSVDGEALSDDELDALTVHRVGAIVRDARWPEGASIEVAYVHGYESFPPAALPVRDLAAYLLTPSPTDWDERATAVSTDQGSYSIVVPGVRGAVFPLPNVNAFVEANEFPSVG
jgi:hypothetical protein